MASFINQGDSIFIPFRNGRSISDSQMKPRMYKTVQAFEKSFPKHYLGTDGVELVEYALVVHGRWINQDSTYTKYQCSACKERKFDGVGRYCPNCGARMDAEE